MVVCAIDAQRKDKQAHRTTHHTTCTHQKRSHIAHPAQAHQQRKKDAPVWWTSMAEIHLQPDRSFLTSACFSRWYTRTCVCCRFVGEACVGRWLVDVVDRAVVL